jgi:hypothetical protein
LPPVQLTPHWPQLFPSTCVFTHAPPQLTFGVAQTVVHEPLLHTWPEAHFVPHAPQLVGSVCLSTHTPVHASVPPGHEHVPPLQTCAVGHVFPQAPQFSGSWFVFAQVPPQFV